VLTCAATALRSMRHPGGCQNQSKEKHFALLVGRMVATVFVSSVHRTGE